MPDYAEAEAIFDATFNKTAVYSFSAPLCAGALLAGASAEAIAALDAEGGRLGLAFQLVDDLIGAFGSAEQAGRDEGGDLRESKRTPLIALARQTPTWARVERRARRRPHRSDRGARSAARPRGERRPTAPACSDRRYARSCAHRGERPGFSARGAPCSISRAGRVRVEERIP